MVLESADRVLSSCISSSVIGVAHVPQLEPDGGLQIGVGEGHLDLGVRLGGRAPALGREIDDYPREKARETADMSLPLSATTSRAPTAFRQDIKGMCDGARTLSLGLIAASAPPVTRLRAAEDCRRH